MNRAPSFQFYPRDWLDFKVQRMSLAAQGAYLKILCYMWNDSKDQCSITDDDELIARGLGTSVDTWTRLRLEIQKDSDPILATENGCLVSRRLKAEASKQRKYRKLQALKGTLSSQRRLNRGSTAVQPEYQPDANSSSTSSSTSSEKTKPPKPPRGRGGGTPAPEVSAVFDCWNQHAPPLIRHRTCNGQERYIRAALKAYPLNEIVAAIERYAQVRGSPGQYREIYAWTLGEFLSLKGGMNLARFNAENWQDGFRPFQAAAHEQPSLHEQLWGKGKD